MVIFKKDCPIRKELDEALKTISGYSITDEEKRKCMWYFLILKCCCRDNCRYSPLSRFVAVRFLKTCSIINALPYVRYDPNDNHRILGIYENKGKIKVEVG